MVRKRRYVLAVLGGALLLLGAPAARTAAFHFLPLSWTGEGERLANVLNLQPGAVVADIGAGDGDMAVRIAHAVGSGGVVYATELSEKRRSEISRVARAEKAPAVRVVAARERSTGLPDACCDAVYLRNVLHHIDDRAAYARELRKTLKTGGRLAIIDFRPGAFFHLAGGHGVTPEDVTATMTAAGFRVERRVDDWGGRLFLILFRD